VAKKKQHPKLNKTATTKSILNLLLVRHSPDVCVPECKGGPTWYGKHERMDLWTMARSYSNPRTCVYEIKSNRRDFIQDKKWMSYLPYCNEFYFAAPWGVLQPEEIPEDAGLVVTSKNSCRLYTKKKAPYRNIEVPLSLFMYVMMSRAQVGYEGRIGSKDVGYWRDWLLLKDEKKQIGWNVSRKVAELVSERVDRADTKIHEMEKRVEKLKAVQTFVDTLGVNIHSWNMDDAIKARLEEIENGGNGMEETLELLMETEHMLRDKREELRLILRGKK